MKKNNWQSKSGLGGSEWKVFKGVRNACALQCITLACPSRYNMASCFCIIILHWDMLKGNCLPADFSTTSLTMVALEAASGWTSTIYSDDPHAIWAIFPGPMPKERTPKSRTMYSIAFANNIHILYRVILNKCSSWEGDLEQKTKQYNNTGMRGGKCKTDPLAYLH